MQSGGMQVCIRDGVTQENEMSKMAEWERRSETVRPQVFKLQRMFRINVTTEGTVKTKRKMGMETIHKLSLFVRLNIITCILLH